MAAEAASGGRAGDSSPLRILPLLRRHAVILLVLLFAAGCYFTWTCSASIGQLGGDGASYLMMAQHYAPYGGHDRVYAEAATFSQFPPLYPLLLAWSGAAAEPVLAHAVTTACLLLALYTCYAWLLAQGIPAAHSALTVLALAAIPGSWMTGLMFQSEYLYLLLSLLALHLLERYRQARKAEALYAAALAVAAAALSRSAGVTLLPALLIVARGAPRPVAGVAAALALLPLLGWHLAHQAQHGYAAAFLDTYRSGGWHFLHSQVQTELAALHRGFAENFQRTAALPALIDGLGLFCLAAGLYRATGLAPDAVYIVVYLALLLLWPSPADAQRFLWVVLPVLLAQPVLLAARWPWPTIQQAITAALAGMMLAQALPAIAFAADRYRAAAWSNLPQDSRGLVVWYRPDPQSAREGVESQLAIIGVLSRIPQRVPAGDCVIATRPELINYFGHRRSVLPPLNSAPDAAFAAAIEQSGCRYAFGVASGDDRYPALHPLQRLGPDSRLIDIGRLDGPYGTSFVMAALAMIGRSAR